MTAQPLCPLVLGLLAARPGAGGDVARELAGREITTDVPAHRAAAITLRRLQRAGLIYAQPSRHAQEVFRVTARGRRELALQRSLRRAAALSVTGRVAPEAADG